MRIVRPSSLAMAGATLAIALSVTTMTASAASTFLLQFGTHETESAARAQWDQLQSQYPDLLGNMSVRIAPVDDEFRTQASGVINRDMAQQTCSRLTANKIECLVVETSMYAPLQANDDVLYAPLAAVEENISVEMASNNREAVNIEEEALTPQPTVTAAEVAPAQPVKEKSLRETLLPWLGFGDEQDEAPQPVAAAPAQEPVQVAEIPRPQRIESAAPMQTNERAAAVSLSRNLPTPIAQPAQAALQPGETRVVAERAPRPLQAPQNEVQQQFAEAVSPQQPQMPETSSQPASSQAHVEVAEAIQVPLSFGDSAPVPANKPVGYGGFPSQPLTERALWVQMSHFTNKESAMNYWRQISAQNPEMMRLLRVRIVSPLRASGLKQTASLRMGPFTDRNEINRICGVAAQNKLRCTFVQEVGSSAAANTVRTPGHIESHNLRQATSRTYSRSAGMPPSGMFWVQLGAFASVADAQQRWDALKITHNDILGRMQPQISYPALSSSPTPVYHLRMGPFMSQSSAITNCNSLQTRQVGCVVVQSR